MQSALKLQTRILPGKRIEVSSPELPESGEVELIVMMPERANRSNGAEKIYVSAIDFLNSLPPSTLTEEDWEQKERDFQAERNSWDR